ncbi:MAG: hypothetical protein ACJ8EY_10280 [Sphingomicrobium sp.]
MAASVTQATAHTGDPAHNLPVAVSLPSARQRTFVIYYTGTLIDLVVLGLFNEFTDKVFVSSFSVGLLTALVLQLLLKLTIAVEHRVLGYFKGAQGAGMKVLKFLCAWLILFGSKFVILEALSIVFGDEVHFTGVYHGIVWLIIVVVTMVVVEEVMLRLYRKLA